MSRGITHTALAATLLFGMARCTSGDVDFQPVTGIWSYTDGGLADNTCGTDNVYRDPDTSFWLTNHFDGTFTVEQGAQGAFDCTLSGASFFCPRRLSVSQPVQGYDATLIYHVSVSGTLSARTTMGGEQHVEVSCAGADCALAPLAGLTVPCTYTVAFTANAQ
jgi:hypothetical protein